MAIGGFFDPYSFMGVDDYKEAIRAQQEAPCLSCMLVHGPSTFDWMGNCEIKQVKILEENEAKEKKHNENIRKLYWERYCSSI